jgi:phenylpropionate dioxygenase-like ring-hydroxylating dioxygenase large terminal subunit
MQRTADKAALDQWYCIEQLQEIAVGRSANRLLGTDLAVVRNADGDITVTIAGLEKPLPTRQRYGCLWTTLGIPATDLLRKRMKPTGA